MIWETLGDKIVAEISKDGGGGLAWDLEGVSMAAVKKDESNMEDKRRVC